MPCTLLIQTDINIVVRTTTTKKRAKIRRNYCWFSNHNCLNLFDKNIDSLFPFGLLFFKKISYPKTLAFSWIFHSFFCNVKCSYHHSLSQKNLIFLFFHAFSFFSITFLLAPENVTLVKLTFFAVWNPNFFTISWFLRRSLNSLDYFLQQQNTCNYLL